MAFGDYKVEFFEKKLEEVKIAAAVTRDEVKYQLEGTVEKTSKVQFSEIKPGIDKNDPWKGQFSGKSLNGNRRLTAKVIPTSDSSELFYITLKVQSTNPIHYNAQLIVMTHDTNLLSNKIFRCDQIWFTEKNRYGATSLYSLAEYKVRNDASFESDYIKGKYGAIPYIQVAESFIETHA